MNVELSRDAAEALSRLPLAAEQRAQFVRAVSTADSRNDLPVWATDYLALAFEQPEGQLPSYALGSGISFEHGRMTVREQPRA